MCRQMRVSDVLFQEGWVSDVLCHGASRGGGGGGGAGRWGSSDGLRKSGSVTLCFMKRGSATYCFMKSGSETYCFMKSESVTYCFMKVCN